MAEFKLISADVSCDCGEAGDIVYITTKWQNCGERPNFNMQIAADFNFCGRQRRENSQTDSFRVTWSPFPNTCQWENGDVWSTTGAWQIPETWGGSFKASVSLVKESGGTVEFVGRDEKPTMCQEICEFDIGWGYGRYRLLQQQKPIHIDLNNEVKVDEGSKKQEFLYINDFRFNKDYIAICGYKDTDWFDFKPILKFRKVSDNSFYTIVGLDGAEYVARKINNGIAYSVKTDYCSFEILVESKNGYLEFNIANIKENDNYELLSVEMPSLAQLSAPDTVFTNFYGGGRRINLKDAFTQSVDFRYDACNIIAAASSNATFCLDAQDVDNILRQSVIKKDGAGKCVNLGAIIRKHISANKSGLKSISVDLKPLKLWYLDKEDWQISAQVLKRQLNVQSPRYYDNTLMYKIMLDGSGQYHPEKPMTKKFADIIKLFDVRDMILRVFHMSGGMRQVVYLIGWQTGGHDFEYPYPHRREFNPNCGSIEEFNALREELKVYNVELSLHDNFDDAYLSNSHDLNNAIICKDEYENNWRGFMWAGGMSYIISPKAYVNSNDLEERIDAMITNYGIEKSYHLDVLSSEVLRYSFDPQIPASADENIRAKCEIVKKFNEKGIDITSETLVAPFVGVTGYAHNTRYDFDNVLFSGEEVVPLTTLAFHGTIPYGNSADETLGSQLKAIAVGAASSFNLEADSTTHTIMRNIYISTLPMSKLVYKRAINIEATKDKWQINYEDNSSVFVDFKNCKYKIVCEGNVISENFKTFMPLKGDTYCYYSVNFSTPKLNLPENWENATVFEITEKGERVRFRLNKENGFTFEAQADTPYVIKEEL